jgi:hypothetical protein
MLQETEILQSKAVKSKRTDSAEAAGVSAIWTGTVPLIGEVCKIAPDGTFLVDFPANPLGPLEARTLVEDLCAGAKVLVVFEQGDPTRPIVLGVVHDRARGKARELHLKAKTVVIEADDAISLQCGEARVEAFKNGKLRLRGKDIVSRASRTNKIQGSTVRLN